MKDHNNLATYVDSFKEQGLKVDLNEEVLGAMRYLLIS